MHSRHAFCDGTRAAFGHHIVSIELCSARQGSSLRSDPLRGPAGLDDVCAQLEGSTYVMAEEARCIFSIDPSSQQTYGEDLVGAITAPSPLSHPTRRAAAIALRATLQLPQ
jgi:hypothetical protein